MSNAILAAIATHKGVSNYLDKMRTPWIIVSTMPIENFRLTYAGEKLLDGTMDVYDLAPALVGLADLVRDSNHLLNGNRAEVSVRVDADFKKSSFEIQLLVDQTLLEHAKQTLEFLANVDAKALLDYLFGKVIEHGDKVIEVAALGLLALYKELKGDKPKPENIKIDGNSGTIVIDQRTINADAKTIQLYMNDPIRSDLDRVVQPVANAGIDDLRVSRDGNVVDELRKEDLPRRLASSEIQNQLEDGAVKSTREALVKVTTANFEQGKWRFSDGSSKFSAKIADPVFQQKLDSREEGFYKGDVLRVLA
jgi:hypothetical protein